MEGTKADLLERAEELGLDVSEDDTKAQISAAIDAAEGTPEQDTFGLDKAGDYTDDTDGRIRRIQDAVVHLLRNENEPAARVLGVER